MSGPSTPDSSARSSACCSSESSASACAKPKDPAVVDCAAAAGTAKGNMSQHVKVGSSEQSSSPSNESSHQISEAKQRLRSALSRHHGLTSHPEVMAIVDELTGMNPTPRPAHSPLMLGDWANLSAPAFPNRIGPEEGKEDIFQYTLGRMSFNLFEPNDVICTLESIRSPIEIVRRDDGKGREADEDDADAIIEMSYPFLCAITIHTNDGDLPATMFNSGTAVPQTGDRCSVVFTAGSLSPASSVLSDATKMALWRKTFENAYAKAAAERSYLSWMGRAIFHRLLQLTAPTDAAAALRDDNSFHFEMKRAPHGYFDVLFLDEELRITKGNRGSYVVVERGGRD